jgi:DNA-binding transcriptional LysR family regulator
MRINFELSDLEAFLAVADLRSFQRAAEQLNVSQPALTRRIQKLETSLAVTLFDRTTRSVKLTLAGKSLRGRAQAMLDDALETMLALQDETARFEHQRNAIVTIAVVPSATHRILPKAIRMFREAGNTARIRIHDRLANDVAEAVANGDADFGVCSIPSMEPNLDFELLANDRFVLTMRRDHPLAAADRVRWKDIADEKVVLPMKTTGNRMLIDEALARSRQTAPWAYEVRRTTTALGLVEAGIGVAVLPETAIPDDPDAVVISRPLIGPTVTRAIGVLRSVGRTLTPPAEAMIGFLKTAVRI